MVGELINCESQISLDIPEEIKCNVVLKISDWTGSPNSAEPDAALSWCVVCNIIIRSRLLRAGSGGEQSYI